MDITVEQLKAIYTEAPESKINLYIHYLNTLMDEYEINTPQRQRMFLAQIGHESGELRYTEEIASGEAYEGRSDLGNVNPGDGVRYKGRGLIQLTGRYNYTRMAKDTGLPLVDRPEILAEKPYYSVLAACWFWKVKNLNSLCDQGKFELLTKRINGGLNGYAHRYRLYQRALKVI